MPGSTQWYRCIGGCACQIARIQCPTIGRSDVARWIRLQRREFGGDTTQRFAKRKLNGGHRFEPAEQVSERDLKRGERGGQALSQSHTAWWTMDRESSQLL